MDGPEVFPGDGNPRRPGRLELVAPHPVSKPYRCAERPPHLNGKVYQHVAGAQIAHGLRFDSAMPSDKNAVIACSAHNSAEIMDLVDLVHAMLVHAADA